jgi:hypothetical protein
MLNNAFKVNYGEQWVPASRYSQSSPKLPWTASSTGCAVTGFVVSLMFFFADVIRYALDCCERLYHETVASMKGQYARQLDTARAACRAEVLASACQFVIMYVSHVWSLLQVEERVAQAGLESADVYAPQLIAARVVRFFCGPCCAQAFDVDYRTNRHWSVLWRARTEKSWSQSMRRCSSGLQHYRGFATRCRLC